MTKHSPFRYFKTSPEIIRLAVALYVRFPLLRRNVEDLLHERGVGNSYGEGYPVNILVKQMAKACINI
jgi:putative transposase